MTSSPADVEVEFQSVAAPEPAREAARAGGGHASGPQTVVVGANGHGPRNGRKKGRGARGAAADSYDVGMAATGAPGGADGGAAGGAGRADAPAISPRGRPHDKVAEVLRQAEERDEAEEDADHVNELERASEEHIKAAGGIPIKFWLTFPGLDAEHRFNNHIWYANRRWRRVYVWVFSLFSIFALLSAGAARESPDDWETPTHSIVVTGLIVTSELLRIMIDGAAPEPLPGRRPRKRLPFVGGISRFFARHRVKCHLITELLILYLTTAEPVVACWIGYTPKWYNQCEDMASGNTTHHQFAAMWIAVDSLVVAVVLALPWYHTVFLNWSTNIALLLGVAAVAPSRFVLSLVICLLIFPTIWAVTRTFELERRTSFLLQRVLGRQRREALSIVKAQDNVMNYVAHELRNPIHGASGCTHLLRQSRDLSDSSSRELRAIGHCTDQLSRLVNDLLDLGRLRHGKLQLRPRDTYVVDMVRLSVTSVLSLSIVPVRVTFEKNVPLVARIDPLRVQQVLHNALINAFKATEVGTVDVNVGFMHDTLLFAIRDTGNGIGEADDATLFEPFRQVDTFTRRGESIASSGLGLAICRSLVRQMGGVISLQNRTDFAGSNPGGVDAERPIRGAQLAFSVPTPFVARRPADVSDVRDPPTQGTGPMSWAALREGRSGTVVLMPASGDDTSTEMDVTTDEENERPDRPLALVVDDVVLNRYIARRMLNSLGFRVVVCSDGNDVMPTMHRWTEQGTPVSVVLIDIHMRVMSGLDALNAARDAGDTTPFIAATGDNVALLDERYFIEKGFDAVLPKPFVSHQLIAAIQAAMPGWTPHESDSEGDSSVG